VAALLCLAWCGAAGAEPSPPISAAAAPDKVRLQLKWQHQFQSAGYYAAIAQGYYRTAGLEVQITEALRDCDPVQEVTAGRAAFGIGTSELVLSRSQGQPVVVLASIFQHSPFVLLANRKAGIQTIHDLIGKRVAIETQAAELLAFMRQNGVDLSRIQRVAHPHDIAPLLRGEIDALTAYSTDELYSVKQSGMPYVVFNPRTDGIDFYGDCLFTSEEQIRLHPDRVDAFVSASLQGWRYALDHPDEMIDLIYTQYSRRHTREQLQFEAINTRHLILPDIIEIGYMNPGRWRFIADTYIELGMVPAGFSLDGFLRGTPPRPHLEKYYIMIVGLAILLGLALGVVVWFHRLSRRLQREIRERVKTERQLRMVEERNRVLIEQAPFPLAISDFESGQILYGNPRMAQIFRLDPKTIVGRKASEFYTKSASRRILIETLRDQTEVTDLEFFMRRADGEPFWAFVSAARIMLEGREVLLTAFNDISLRKQTEIERDALILELQQALAEIHTLSGLIPICCSCKRIRDDAGFWQQVEAYIAQYTQAKFTHGFCPECLEKQYKAVGLKAEASKERTGSIPGDCG
jgi:PAS domain S-box-containing protein